MTNASRGTMIRLVAFGVPCCTSSAQSRPPIAEQLAKTYGLDSFGQIAGIRYTFNVDFPGVKLSQTWEWQPKTGQVSYEGKDKAGKPVKLTYLRSQLSSQAADGKDETDPAFINDQYWLLFPLHVSWDSSADVEDRGMHKLPLGKGSAEAGPSEISLRGWLHARRYLGTLCRLRQPSSGIYRSPRRKQKAECRRRDVGGLQEKPALSLSQQTTAGPRTANRCGSSFQVCRSS
jgi:hypothetical protein